jgi:hypothetical protein
MCYRKLDYPVRITVKPTNPPPHSAEKTVTTGTQAKPPQEEQQNKEMYEVHRQCCSST